MPAEGLQASQSSCVIMQRSVHQDTNTLMDSEVALQDEKRPKNLLCVITSHNGSFSHKEARQPYSGVKSPARDGILGALSQDPGDSGFGLLRFWA